MFQFPGLPSHGLSIHPRMSEDFPSDGLPHSDTHDSLTVYVSSWRFAVFCVLLPLCMPRHPPYALLHLIMPAIYDEFINSTFLRTVNCLFQLSVNLFYNFSERPICLSSVIQFSKNFTSMRFFLRNLFRSLKTEQKLIIPLTTYLYSFSLERR